MRAEQKRLHTHPARAHTGTRPPVAAEPLFSRHCGAVPRAWPVREGGGVGEHTLPA